MSIIEAKDIVKTFRMGETEITALKGVSLSVEKGEFVAITGFSGSGKSTLMHVLGCLDIPTSGSYVIDGVDASKATRDELAKIRNQKIGFVFQKFYLLPDLTALDNVALPCLYAGENETAAREKAKKLLELVGLEHRMDHFPYQLSGGQQQRVAIARALVNEPAMIMADEPTGNLDRATGENILQVFKDFNEKQNVTIVIVTHEQSIAARTKRIVELVDGKIVSDKRTQ
ncbi:MAG: Macrolide-specific efflux protein MacB [candidate division TM6 bacterium GW2011_GWF2_36_6]|nr:MAG: Macrolide-specific efflux protein MacB [candidate division TM6 bacterium GW2011_GWF2_36_6]